MTAKVFSGKCRTYVTMGPILFADGYFGKTFKIKKNGEFTLSFDTMSVIGISKAEIFTSGRTVAAVKEFAVPSLNKESLSFTFKPEASTWYNIIVTDAEGKRAISNPIWIEK